MEEPRVWSEMVGEGSTHETTSLDASPVQLECFFRNGRLMQKWMSI